MFKLVKWAYDRGVLAERHRIRNFIQEHRAGRPQKPDTTNKGVLRQYEIELAAWERTNAIFDQLTYLHQEQVVYKSFLDIDEKL